MFLNSKYIKILTFIFFVFFTDIYFSQPGPPPGPTCWPPPCIPVDGGISVFTFLSILFGYKLASNNK
jgi:hypothetical protein